MRWGYGWKVMDAEEDRAEGEDETGGAPIEARSCFYNFHS